MTVMISGDTKLRGLERQAAAGDEQAVLRLNQEYARREMWDKWESPSLVKHGEWMRPNRNDAAISAWWDVAGPFFAGLPENLKDDETAKHQHSATFQINSWATIDFSGWTNNGRAVYEVGFREYRLTCAPGRAGHYRQTRESFARIYARLNKIWTEELRHQEAKATRKHQRLARQEQHQTLAAAFALGGFWVVSNDVHGPSVGPLRFKANDDQTVTVSGQAQMSFNVSQEGAFRIAQVVQEELEKAEKRVAP